MKIIFLSSVANLLLWSLDPVRLLFVSLNACLRRTWQDNYSHLVLLIAWFLVFVWWYVPVSNIDTSYFTVLNILWSHIFLYSFVNFAVASRAELRQNFNIKALSIRCFWCSHNFFRIDVPCFNAHVDEQCRLLEVCRSRTVRNCQNHNPSFIVHSVSVVASRCLALGLCVDSLRCYTSRASLVQK